MCYPLLSLTQTTNCRHCLVSKWTAVALLLAQHQHVTFCRFTERAEALKNGAGRAWLEDLIIAPPISRMRTFSPPWLRFRGTVTTFYSQLR